MSRPDRDRFEGCLLGLALGDALGAPHEGGPIERLVWRVIGRTAQGARRFTDDTQMSLDLADSLVARGALDRDDLAHRFAEGYRWSRGYGPGAARVLRRIAGGVPWEEASRSVYPEGSFGNGGAMRAPAIGLFHASRPELVAEAARAQAAITHAHPLGQEGAALIATATALAARGEAPSEILEGAARACALPPFQERLEVTRAWRAAGDEPSPALVARRLGNGIAAAESCVTALHVALRFLERSFVDMMAFLVDAGGDVDTLGAMAGAVWGAARGAGALPTEALSRLEQRARIADTAGALHARAAG